MRVEKRSRAAVQPAFKIRLAEYPHEDAESGDWFGDWHVLDYIHKEVNLNGEILNNYCKALETIELAVMAKEALLLREEE